MEKINLLAPFQEFITKNHLVAPEDRVLVAVSGGRDSVAMLDLFSRYFKESSRWGVIYVNHGWDMERHEKEEALVGDLAKKYSVRFQIKKITPTSKQSLKGMSLEAGARQERYRLFSEAMAEGGYTRCATGHTLDDQAETVLMRLLLGSGMWGLAGIPVQRGMFIRPLMGFYRAEVEKYVAFRQLPYLEDPSNQEVKFRRVRIRRELLPLLEHKYNPKVKQALVALGNDIAQWYDETKKSRKSPIMVEKGKILLAQSDFFSYLDILRKFWLQEALQEATGEYYPLRRHHLKQVSSLAGEGKTGKWVKLPGGIRMLRDRDHLVLIAESEPATEEKEVNLGIHHVPLLGVVFKGEEVHRSEVNFSGSGWEEWMDGDKLPTPWILRRWRYGDRFYPLWAPGRKKVSDLLVDRKVSRCEKDRVLVLEAGGEIVWVVGYRMGQGVAITEGTKRVVRLEVRQI